MGQNVKKELLLQGMCCSNCAAKIERGSKKIVGVKNATVDFASKKLTLCIESNDEVERVIGEAKKLINSVDSGISVRII